MNINEALNILNLKGDVTKEDITKAYKKLAIKYHPDRNDSGAEIMKNINSAYDFLKGINLDDLKTLNKTKEYMLEVVNSAYQFLTCLDLDNIKHTDDKNAYNYSADLENVIFNVLKMDGVIIEICGNWVWLSGKTKENKDKISKLGFIWAKKKAKWYYRPAEHKCRRRSCKPWDMEDIRNKYGSTIINLQTH